MCLGHSLKLETEPILQMSCGTECGLGAEDPTVVKWADGVVSWMAEEDVGVQMWSFAKYKGVGS